MTSRCVLPLLLASLALASPLPSHAGDPSGRSGVVDARERSRVVDPAKAKAREADRQRLLAKLRDDAPKLEDRPPPNPLDAPIFHRHDRR